MRLFNGKPAVRRYTFRVLTAMSFYTAFLLLAIYTFRHHSPHGATAYLVALLPALPIIAVIVVVGLYLAEEPDEFQRTVLIQTFLWSIGLTLGVTTAWGFLELLAGIPHLQPYLDFPVFWFFVGVVSPVVRWRYR